MNHRKYEVWHDECKIGAYYHGIFLVPVDKKDDIIRLLKCIRDEYKISHQHDLKFAGCLKKEKMGRIISNHLSLFSHIIKTKEDNKSTLIFNHNKKAKYKKEFEHFLEVCNLFGCRFGLLKIEDNMQSMYFDTYAKKVEVTLRFLFKACCHGMFDGNNPIEISKFYFDGDEHHGGNIDIKTIIKGELRDYCKLSNPIRIDSRQISNRDDETKLLINFVDNMIGAWRALLDGESDQHNVLYPIKNIYDRVKGRKIFSNTNGRWYRSISLSEFYIENNETRFHDIFRNPNQKTLF